MTKTMACLSIRQPWASLIVAGIKNIENRGWYCAHRGPLLIHASKIWSRNEQEAYNELLQIAIDMNDTRRQDLIYQAKDCLGGFVGICHMQACLHEAAWFEEGGARYDGRTNWFVGPFGWVLARARAFTDIVPYRGQQGLFRVPVSHIPLLPNCLMEGLK